MTRILVTGMSGAGKSTVLAELARRGHRTVDTDYDGWTGPDGRWDERRMAALLDEYGGEHHLGSGHLVVSGTVDNQGRFHDRFEHVVLLTAPLAILLERVAARAGNPYGRTRAQRAEIARFHAEVEPLLRRSATRVVDTRQAAERVADEVERLLRGAGTGQ